MFRHIKKLIKGLTKNKTVENAEKLPKMVKQLCV